MRSRWRSRSARQAVEQTVELAAARSGEGVRR